MKITENFSWEELTRTSTGLNNTPPMDAKAYLLELCLLVLQPIRNEYGKPIIVTSGYRSEAVNKAVGGVKNSQHLKGQAADIKTDCRANNKTLFELIVKMIEDKKIKVGQLIDEKNYSWIHISLPTDKHLNEIFSL